MSGAFTSGQLAPPSVVCSSVAHRPDAHGTQPRTQPSVAEVQEVELGVNFVGAAAGCASTGVLHATVEVSTVAIVATRSARRLTLGMWVSLSESDGGLTAQQPRAGARQRVALPVP